MFGGHEEGRIRAVYANAQIPDLPTNFVYDYFLKDHLGNVRMVLTEEEQRDIYPVASLEPSKLATEKNYYDIFAFVGIVEKVRSPLFSSAVVGVSPTTSQQAIAGIVFFCFIFDLHQYKILYFLEPAKTA